jgi:hypothetical protein
MNVTPVVVPAQAVMPTITPPTPKPTPIEDDSSMYSMRNFGV